MSIVFDPEIYIFNTLFYEKLHKIQADIYVSQYY